MPEQDHDRLIRIDERLARMSLTITASYASAADATTAAGIYATGPNAITATLSDPNGKLGGYYVVLNQGALTITAG